MKTLNKNLLMGGVAACAVAVASCGDKKTDSAATDSDTDRVPATSTDGAAATAEKTETVSINLSGLM